MRRASCPKNGFLPFAAAFALLAGALGAAEIAGIPRDSNTGNTGGYDASRVEAQMLVQVGEDTRVVHFIRDNNDPRVVTKTYVLKYVNPYSFRDYLRQMVQSKRVGNATLLQQYPSNTTTRPYVATESEPVLSDPTVQPSYNPAVQLGGNTAVECLKYVDGTSLLLVSAEEYRFEDNENGIGIDHLVEMFDVPAMQNASCGAQMFIYMPKFVPARNLMPLIENMGMNISDVTELWQGADVVAYDPDLNWLIFDVSNFSTYNIASMLRMYDVPIPQVRLKIQVYELTTENDDKIGIDFQAWKNNEGVDFFSVGGRYRNNWEAIYTGAPMPDRAFGSERTSFYNFNPKWNSRYLDFLATHGRAKLVHSGELVIRNNNQGALAFTTQLIYIDDSQPVPGAVDPGTPGAPDYQVGPYKLLSNIIGRAFPTGADIGVGKGNQQITTVSETEFGFTLNVANVSVNLDETSFDVTVANTSLLGFQSSGAPRISKGNVVTQRVSLPHGRDGFVIGGLSKQEQVTSKTGVPWLCDIPYLGYLFGTESTSVKHAQLVVVGQCEWDAPPNRPYPAITARSTHGNAATLAGGGPPQ